MKTIIQFLFLFISMPAFSQLTKTEQLNDTTWCHYWGINRDRMITVYNKNLKPLVQTRQEYVIDKGFVDTEKETTIYNAAGEVLSDLYQHWKDNKWVNSTLHLYTYNSENESTTYMRKSWINSKWVIELNNQNILEITKKNKEKEKAEAEEKKITDFELYIINSVQPDNTEVKTKYENDYRVIVWNDPLIKSYKYSNEQFDKLGYEFVKLNVGDNQQGSKVYRNCQKGIIVEVTEWYNVKLSISMQWYEPNVRKSIGYLMYCSYK